MSQAPTAEARAGGEVLYQSHGNSSSSERRSVRTLSGNRDVLAQVSERVSRGSSNLQATVFGLRRTQSTTSARSEPRSGPSIASGQGAAVEGRDSNGSRTAGGSNGSRTDSNQTLVSRGAFSVRSVLSRSRSQAGAPKMLTVPSHGGSPVKQPQSRAMTPASPGLSSGLPSGLPSEVEDAISGGISGGTANNIGRSVTPTNPPSNNSTSRAFTANTIVSRITSAVASNASCKTDLRAYSATSFRRLSIKNLTINDARLFRGTFAADSALRRGGAILGDGPSTAEQYRLSRPVDHVDVFVSHNWSTPRWDKFLVLALYLNFRAAWLCTVALAALLASLTATGTLPILELDSGIGEYSLGPWCLISCPTTFMVVILCGHDVGRLCGWRGKVLFLDKVCVHQTDEDLKQRGVEHLAAFLYYSWSMVICFSDVYMQKLWTVYEVSSFLMLHPGSAVHVRHVCVPKFVLGSIAIQTFAFSVILLAHATKLLERLPISSYAADIVLSLVVFIVPAGTAVCMLLHRIVAERMKIAGHIERFRMSHAKCQDEADRVVLQRNIVAFMKYHSLVEQDSSSEEVMQEYEALVRTELPRLFDASLGRVGLPFHLAATAPLPGLMAWLDLLAADLQRGESPWFIGLRMVHWITFLLAVMPLGVAMGAAVARYLIRRPYIGHKASIAAVTATLLAWSHMGFYGLSYLRAWASDGDGLGVAALACLSASYGVATLFVYRPMAPSVQHRRRLSTEGSLPGS